MTLATPINAFFASPPSAIVAILQHYFLIACQWLAVWISFGDSALSQGKSFRDER